MGPANPSPREETALDLLVTLAGALRQSLDHEGRRTHDVVVGEALG
jgi:hypothetical protein